LNTAVLKTTTGKVVFRRIYSIRFAAQVSIYRQALGILTDIYKLSRYVVILTTGIQAEEGLQKHVITHLRGDTQRALVNTATECEVVVRTARAAASRAA
jgi:hypothetical protein